MYLKPLRYGPLEIKVNNLQVQFPNFTKVIIPIIDRIIFLHSYLSKLLWAEVKSTQAGINKAFLKKCRPSIFQEISMERCVFKPYQEVAVKQGEKWNLNP